MYILTYEIFDIPKFLLVRLRLEISWKNVKWHDTKMDRQVKSNYRIAGVVHWAVLSRSSTLKKKLTELLSPENKIIIVLKVYSMCFSRVHLPTSMSLSASVIHTLTCAAWSITRLLRFTLAMLILTLMINRAVFIKFAWCFSAYEKVDMRTLIHTCAPQEVNIM